MSGRPRPVSPTVVRIYTFIVLIRTRVGVVRGPVRDMPLERSGDEAVY